ncbi:MAG: TfoX/Sxy family protein [Mizugakiibacter sp.]|uniref:TfoX/Sxy family protein n=1 Tax=Mizugakiibacter sp. TaxID=1972610 RepID=UPI0031BD2A7B|nr:TfoX/Sxy family protein [Xanthomonadaceae bacterium]
MSDAAKIRNIGPKSAAWLRQVGVHTQADLERLGAVEAYMRVKRAGFRASLNLLYALEGALAGCHWAELPAARRGELLLAVDAAEALLPARTRWRPAASVGRPHGGEETAAPADGGDEPAADADDGVAADE